jgi:hypothetical protein
MTESEGCDAHGLRDLERRLALLEAEREILTTLYAYGHALDSGDESMFIDCWTASARLIWPQTGLMVGHEPIRNAFRSHTHSPERLHKHLLMEPIIRTHADDATAESMFARLDDYDGVPEIRSYGKYIDRLVRCEDGRWRFAERLVQLEVIRPGSTDRVSTIATAPAE